ncbi:MAG: VOC family protein [Acidimicrobiia bacterium]|nr:VOC family protein [Acidimicrobiia bacterium]MDH3396755.1 VOC family protein [Acidimicrobiia bacterium]MDH5616219.1 VOC family protein [Acidimicrobiia bacterium]
MLRIDHVIMTVRDLNAAADRLSDSHGLGSVPGGRHRGHGTGNRIVPLGHSYLELMAVVDPDEAPGSPLGRWVADQVTRGDRLAALCLRTDDIEAVARRLGQEPEGMSRQRPDGTELSWRLVGMQIALSEGLPFFIQWDVPAQYHPGLARADHRIEPSGVTWVELGGDPQQLAAWLEPHDLDLRVVPGHKGIRRLGIGTADGEIVL